MDRAVHVHEQFLTRLKAGTFPDPGMASSIADAGLTNTDATQIYLSQLASRQLDRAARALQARGE
ncbi:MAG: hypothetical protein AAGJ50_15010, partial [Pseudomonadota bacterium]